MKWKNFITLESNRWWMDKHKWWTKTTTLCPSPSSTTATQPVRESHGDNFQEQQHSKRKQPLPKNMHTSKAEEKVAKKYKWQVTLNFPVVRTVPFNSTDLTLPHKKGKFGKNRQNSNCIFRRTITQWNLILYFPLTNTQFMATHLSNKGIPYTSKFSRRTIFANCYFQAFRGNHFRGSRVSSTRYSKVSQA